MQRASHTGRPVARKLPVGNDKRARRRDADRSAFIHGCVLKKHTVVEEDRT